VLENARHKDPAMKFGDEMRVEDAVAVPAARFAALVAGQPSFLLGGLLLLMRP